MPKRHANHIIGEKASIAVQAIIADAGFAVETLYNDYGEDLLVQTHHAGEIDASRLWFQVKGSESAKRYRRRDGTLVCSVPAAHAIKWVRSADPVVVVFWDVARGEGWFTRAGHSIWGSVTTGARRVTLTFDPTDMFTSNAVQILAWESRLDRYHQLLLGLEYERRAVPAISRDLAIAALAMDFLSLLGVAEGPVGAPQAWRLADDARRRLTIGVLNEMPEGGGEDARAAVLGAAALVVLAAIEDAMEASDVSGWTGGLRTSLVTLGVNGVLGVSGLANVLSSNPLEDTERVAKMALRDAEASIRDLERRVGSGEPSPGTALDDVPAEDRTVERELLRRLRAATEKHRRV